MIKAHMTFKLNKYVLGITDRNKELTDDFDKFEIILILTLNHPLYILFLMKPQFVTNEMLRRITQKWVHQFFLKFAKQIDPYLHILILFKCQVYFHCVKI